MASIVRLVFSCILAVSYVCGLDQEGMLDLVKSSGQYVVELTDKNANEILGGPRNWYLVILYTDTIERVYYADCGSFIEDFDRIAYSWFKDHANGVSYRNKNKSLYFASATVTERGILSKMLSKFEGINTPQLLLLPPGQGTKNILEISWGDSVGIDRSAHVVAAMRDMTGMEDITVYETTDWVNVLLLAILALVVVILFGRHLELALKIYRFNSARAFVTSLLVTLMCSGYMFVKIKNVPYIGYEKDGSMILVYPGTSNQFGFETLMICVIYATIAVCVILLASGIPAFRRKMDSGTDRENVIITFVIVIVTLSLYVAFAGFTNIYSTKLPEYPFVLPKLSTLLF